MSNSCDHSQGEHALTVLHIAPTPFFSDRGCHIRIKGIIEALEHRLVSSVLCTYHHGRDIPNIEIVRTPTIPGYTKQEAGPSAFKYLADVLLFIKVCSLIGKRRPDIIHGHLHEGVLIGWAAKSIFCWRRIPLVFDMQGSLVGELEAHEYFKKFKLLRQFFWAIEFFITRLPQYTVCSSMNGVNILRTQFGLAPERVRLASDGVDIISGNDVAADHLRMELALPDNKPIILYSGALLPAKGLDTLCQMVLEASRRKLDCHFLLVGYPVDGVASFLAQHNLQPICTVTGRVAFECLSHYLSLATIAVEPKAADAGEASGKLLNYMGAGLPVICFDTINNRQMLGDAGYYATPGSTNELVDSIVAILKAPEEGRQRGAAARSRVQAKYSWDSTAEAIQSVYRSVAHYKS